MQNTTALPYRLVSVDATGKRTLVHAHQTAEEAWDEMRAHLRIVNTVPNLRGWYGPHTGRRLIITGPNHIRPRTIDTTRGI